MSFIKGKSVCGGVKQVMGLSERKSAANTEPQGDGQGHRGL